MLLDINGDQYMDVLYQAEGSNGIKVALGDEDPDTFTTKDFFDFVITPAEDPNCKAPSKSDLISMPNSNAFIDLNGDCLSDIFLTRQTGTQADKQDVSKTVDSYYEIYSQQFVDDSSVEGGKTSKYCLATQNGSVISSKNAMGFSDSLPLIEITDFNRDSMFDLLFVTKEGEITILYNQIKAQTANAENICRDIATSEQTKLDPFFASYPFSSEDASVLKV